MADKDKRKANWQKVREMTDLAAAIKLTADLGEEAILESEAEREELRKAIQELHKILVGNGDPTHSLINRVAKIEEDVGELLSSLGGIRILLVGDALKGDPDTDSLLDKVKRSERVADTASKLTWLIFGALIADIVGHIFGLF